MHPVGGLHGGTVDYTIGCPSAPPSDTSNLVRPLDVTSTRYTTPELSHSTQHLYGLVFAGENNLPASPASDNSLSTPRSLSTTPGLPSTVNVNRRSLPTPPQNPLVPIPRTSHRPSLSRPNVFPNTFTVLPPVYRHHRTPSHASSAPALASPSAPARVSGAGPEFLGRPPTFFHGDGDRPQHVRQLPEGPAVYRIVNDDISAETDPHAASERAFSSPCELRNSSFSSSLLQPRASRATSAKNLLDQPSPPTTTSPSPEAPSLVATSSPGSPTMAPLNAESAPFVPRSGGGPPASSSGKYRGLVLGNMD